MMGLNVLQEQLGVGRLRAAMAGDRRGLVVAASGSQDRGEPLMLGIQRVGILLWAHPAALRVVSRGEQAAWEVSKRDMVNRVVLVNHDP